MSEIAVCSVWLKSDIHTPTTLPQAPDNHPRCVSMVTEWKQAIGLCQDPSPLHLLLFGGGAEGAGLWPSRHPLYEGTYSNADTSPSSMKLTVVSLKLKTIVNILPLKSWRIVDIYCLLSFKSWLMVTAPSFQSPGGSASEIFAKLEVYLWLGLAKYSKESITSLPEEFMPVYDEEEEEEQRVPGNRKLPLSLSCQGESANFIQQGHGF